MKIFTRIFLVIVTITIVNWDSYGQLPGQMPLSPKNVPQFVDPLPHFAGMRVDASGGNLVIRYQPTEQVAVSTGTVLANGIVGKTPGIGKARLWGYSVSNGTVTTLPHWPAFTITARQGTPVNVTYYNDLAGETYASVGLIADQTVHWAAPLGMDMMDMTPYDGPVPVVPHLHGGEVASESDGGPDAWFTPGYSIVGPSWEEEETDQNYYYPNSQEPATLWWHDHALGATRLNVYAGLSGFYILKGPDEENAHLPGWSGDDLVKEVAPAGTTGTFNPNPYLPEIEVVFQDRMFDTYGKLYFPNLPTNPMVHPYWTPEFLGDIITVNGKTWPFLSVAPRKYRFRLLNGSNARFYEISLINLANGLPGPAIIQIGTDGGLLDKPVPIVGGLLLAPGERADVVIDFTGSAINQKWTLINRARSPYPKGSPPIGLTTGRLMQFVVNGTMVSSSNPTNPGIDKSSVPTPLRSLPIVKLTNFAGVINSPPAVKRQLTLNEVMGMGGPLEVLVNNTKWDGNGAQPGLGETELPVEGTTELWQIINLTADAHPIHLHLVQFQIVSRQAFNLNNYNIAYAAAFGGAFVPSVGPPLVYNTPNADGAVGGNPAVTPYLLGALKPAKLNERGWKDTHVVMPGEVTTFIVRYAPTTLSLAAPPAQLVYSFDPSSGPGYAWHCHIIDHEDNEMMRPYKVFPSPSRTLGMVPRGIFIQEPNNLTAKSAISVTEKLYDIIHAVELEQNYPNPFSGATEIRFKLPESSHVTLSVFNSVGVPVGTLINEEAPAGSNTVRFDAANLKPGIYYYQLKTRFDAAVRSMVVK
jgi:FtsP/CotA-like multicopper oxidase with cupredoxin domain